LQPADAAVLGGAAMLHDLALHIRETGFVELVAASTNYNPQPWFSREQVGRIADIGWPRLWESFQYQARHFGTSQLELILGPGCNGVPLVAHDETLRPESWTKADRRERPDVRAPGQPYGIASPHPHHEKSTLKP